LTCWIAFTEIPLDNGPLFIVEGSHKFIDIHDNFKDFDVALNKEQKASIDEHPASFARQRNAKLLTATFTPGDVLIFGMDTLHGAFENYAANNRIRLTCDIRYQPRDKPKDHRYFGVNPSGTTGAGYGELNGARPLIEDWHIR
jgi:ectoine hydroxylase-related dioxygenase (phytanoyl-CoA dioxygenase family)